MTWTENRKRYRLKLPPLPVAINKKPGMNESLDEIMIVVAKETNYTMRDLMSMDIFRFLRVVESIKKMAKARAGELESLSEKPARRARR